MTVRDAVSRCSCAVGFFFLVVAPLIFLCSSLRFRGLFICCCAVCSLCLSLHHWCLRVCRCTIGFFLFFVASLVSFYLLLRALVLLHVVTPLNSFRLSL